MAILDELAGIIGAEAVAKIKADSKITTKLTEGERLYGFYTDDDTTTTTETTTPPVTTQTTDTTSAARSAVLDLKAIEGLLDKKLGGLDDRIKTATTATVEEIIKKRGAELTVNASSIALRNADELNRVYRRHEKDFGEDFDTAKFNEFVETEKKAGRGFASVTDAYEAWTKDRRTEKTIAAAKEEGKREALKERADMMIPGVTPASARTPLGQLLNRGRDKDATGKTSVEKAASSLEARLARHANDE